MVFSILYQDYIFISKKYHFFIQKNINCIMCLIVIIIKQCKQYKQYEQYEQYELAIIYL